MSAIGDGAGKTNFQFQTDENVSAALAVSEGATQPLVNDPDTREFFVYMAARDGRLYCVNMNNGVLNWDFQSGRPIRRKPHVIGANVFVTPDYRGIYCLAKVTGNQFWWTPGVEEFLAATYDRVFAADSAGNVVILNRHTGTLIGTLPLRNFSKRVNNDRTDRLYLATPSGRVVCIREMSSQQPTYHQFPERQPLLPEFAPDE